MSGERPRDSHPAADFPELRQTVIDCLDVRSLATFYLQLLGWEWRPGCETPEEAEDWLVIRAGADGPRLGFQQVDELARPTWPEPAVPQQLHLDLTVPSAQALAAQHERVLGLGATLLLDRFDDPQEPLRVYADPEGHPFCIFVA